MFLLFVPMFLVTFLGFGPRGETVVSHPTDKAQTTQIQCVSDIGGHNFQTVDEEKAKKLIKNHYSRQRTVKRHHPRINRPQEKGMEDILTDQSLWGESFPSVLSSLPAFTRAGEEQVSVFSGRILGRTKYARRGQTEPRVTKLAEELKATQNLTPRSSRMAIYMTKGRIALRAEVYQLPDDRTFRISAAGPTAQFLAPGLSIAAVKRRLGKEEKVTTEVLDDGTDRRPVILTLHHYAGGAIIFVESDVNPNIGSVDRVFLDAPKISAALF